MVESALSSLRSAYVFFIPVFLRPSETFTKTSIRNDIIAGVTVSTILIPQSMALALAAGLPSVYGLYASLFGFLAGVFGSSHHLSTGPVAVTSILTLAALSAMAEPFSPEYITLAAILAFLIGALLLLCGTLRLGFLVHLVPHTVIDGFSAAAALIVAFTQVPTLFGLDAKSADTLLMTLINIIKAIPTATPLPVIFGLLAVLLLLMLKKVHSRIPGALMLVIIGIAASILLHLPEQGIRIVGEIPRGVPTFSIPWLAFSSLFVLIPKALIIAIVGFVQAYSAAKIVAHKTKQKIDINQELVGQGIANLGAGLFRGFPVTGSLSRTAVNLESGAQSALSGVVTAVITLLVAVFFTPLFFYLPKNILAAIVIAAALPLFDWKGLLRTYHVSKFDGYVAIGTFALAVIAKPDDAIFIGMLLALMLFLQQTVWGARITEMAIHPRLNILRRVRNIDEHLETVPGTVIAHIGAPLYYANATYTIERIGELIIEHEVREGVKVHRVVIDASAVSFVDTTGVEILAEYLHELQAGGITTDFIYLRTRVIDILQKSSNFPSYKWYKNISEMHTRNVIAGPTPRSAYI